MKTLQAVTGVSLLLMFGVLSAYADPVGGRVYPQDPKVAFTHENEPWPEDHAGLPVNNLNPMPWFWDPGQNYSNVAGVHFKIWYDPYEIDILGIGGVGPTSTGLWRGHERFDPPPAIPESQGDPATGRSVVTAMVSGTLWISHSEARNSGINLQQSLALHLFDLHYRPKHTSHYSETLFNTEMDVILSELRPIYHVVPTIVPPSNYWHADHTVDLHTVDSGFTYVIQSELKHITKSVVLPKWLVPVSGTYFTALVSDSAPTPLHVPAAAHTNSVWMRVHNAGTIAGIPSSLSYWQHFNSVPGILISPSSFYVGDPVAEYHEGMGIDHVPEPITLALLGLGSGALWMKRRKRL
jgi:hypothetical protein